MIFHANRLLADDSHEMYTLLFSKIGKDAAKFVVCCSCDMRFKGQNSEIFATILFSPIALKDMLC